MLPRHRLAYRLILATGLRRDELKQLRWGDVKLNAPMPCIQLRAETTKAKRADVLPLRAMIWRDATERRVARPATVTWFVVHCHQWTRTSGIW